MRIRMMMLLLAGMCAWAGSASAQAGGVRVSVPFGFGVGGKTFAAGDYIMMAGLHQVRIVSQADGKTLAMTLANDVSGHLAGTNGRIVFRCMESAAIYRRCGRRSNKTDDRCWHHGRRYIRVGSEAERISRSWESLGSEGGVCPSLRRCGPRGAPFQTCKFGLSCPAPQMLSGTRGEGEERSRRS